MENLGCPDSAHPAMAAGQADAESIAKKIGTEGQEEGTAVSSKLFHCACVRRWLPLDYREELYHLLRLTGPLLLSRILNFLISFVTTIFCGHIGNAELAGYALASATINVTTTAAGVGLAMACDTLISQTFGSKNMKRVGVILQQSSLILLLFCLPCWALLINSYNLLLLLHQEYEVARIAHLYVMLFLPAVPAMFLHSLQVSYLQNQGIILPQMYTAAAANIFNVIANYVLISGLQLGVIGSAIANSLSQIVICLMLFGYIRWKKLHQRTWGGWSIDCLQEWDSFMKLAVPSAFMICFEWWIWEIGGFLAGLLGEVDLAAQHVMSELGAITYMFPLGIHAAACVRVGNALGAGNTKNALVTCKVALAFSGLLAMGQGIVIAGCKSFIGYIFTSDENIVELVSKNLTVYIFLQFFDAVLCVCIGIFIGSGVQKIVALSNLVCYYCIALPVGIALMFAAKLRILGLWLGIFICVFLETGFFLVLLYKLDWKKITQKAQQRSGRKIIMATPKRPASIVMSDAMAPDISEQGQFDGEEAPESDGYSRVNTQDKELKGGHEDGVNNGNASRTNPNGKPQELLSVTQLVLRRGFTLLVLLIIFAIGVGFHIGFPVPEPTFQNRTNHTLNWYDGFTPTPLAPLDLTLKLGG